MLAEAAVTPTPPNGPRRRLTPQAAKSRSERRCRLSVRLPISRVVCLRPSAFPIPRRARSLRRNPWYCRHTKRAAEVLVYPHEEERSLAGVDTGGASTRRRRDRVFRVEHLLQRRIDRMLHDVCRNVRVWRQLRFVRDCVYQAEGVRVQQYPRERAQRDRCGRAALMSYRGLDLDSRSSAA